MEPELEVRHDLRIEGLMCVEKLRQLCEFLGSRLPTAAATARDDDKATQIPLFTVYTRSERSTATFCVPGTLEERCWLSFLQLCGLDSGVPPSWAVLVPFHPTHSKSYLWPCIARREKSGRNSVEGGWAKCRVWLRFLEQDVHKICTYLVEE